MPLLGGSLLNSTTVLFDYAVIYSWPDQYLNFQFVAAITHQCPTLTSMPPTVNMLHVYI